MPDPEPLLFEADLPKFMEVALIEDVGRRSDMLQANLGDIVLCEIVRYGVLNDSAMIGPLAELYRERALAGLAEDTRWHLYRLVEQLMEAVDFVSVNALLPFIADETSPRIVASAVIDYVSLGPLTGDDPMSRPKDIVGLIESGRLRNTGAAFGGLLHLGDRRVCKLLGPVKDALTNEEVNTAINCCTNLLHAATIEFEIDWLEGMDGSVEDGLFGNVAAGLVLQKRSNTMDLVFTGSRDFPIPKNPAPEHQARSRERAQPISVAEYTKQIAPRLYALERTEPPPRIMPLVLSAWGLTPITDPSEVAHVNDRHRPAGIQQSSLSVPALGDEIDEVVEEWFDGEGQIFLSWGILNPNGPTLYCLGERIMNGRRRLFYRWLHMLGGRTYYAGPAEGERVTYSEIFETAGVITQALAARSLPTLFNVIPSFVIPNSGDDTIKDIARHLIVADGPETKDWGREAAYIEAFGDNYFARAGCEIRVAYEAEKAKPDISPANRDYLQWIEARYGHIPAFKDAVFPEFRSSALTDELFDKWWNVVGTSQHSTSALRQLAEMWRGATSILSDEMSENTVSFDRVLEFLTNYNFGLPE